MKTIEEMKSRQRALIAKCQATLDRAKDAARDLTKAEQAECETDLQEVRTLKAEIATRAARRKSFDELGPLFTGDDPESGGNGLKGRRTFDHFARTLAANGAKAFIDAGPNAKAVTVTTMADFTAGSAYVANTAEQVAGPDPALGVLALLNGDVVREGKNFSYLQENAGNTSNAAIVADSELKPTSTKKLNEITDELKFIAHISQPIPNRFLSDYKGFSDYLSTVMARDLVRVMNTEVVNGDGTATHLKGILNTSGVLAQAWTTDLPTTLRKARTKLQTKDEQPTAWLVSAADAETIDLMKDTTGQFISLKEILGNLPVVVSAGLPTGTAILGNWKLATLMSDGKGVKLDVTDSSPYSTGNDVNGNPIISGNLFRRNMVEVRSELRVGGLAVTRPSGFVVVDLTV